MLWKGRGRGKARPGKIYVVNEGAGNCYLFTGSALFLIPAFAIVCRKRVKLYSVSHPGGTRE